MIFLSCILAMLTQVYLTKVHFLNGLVGTAEFFHHQGFLFIEKHQGPYNWFYEALLLGHDDGLRAHAELTAFFTLGLYHLVVVSGKHVTALDRLLSKFFFFFSPRWQRWVIFFFLFIFSLLNRLQSSCVRAVIQWALFGKKKLSPALESDLQCIVTCLGLILEPQWIHSLSFQISSCATLALSIARTFAFTPRLFHQIFVTLCCFIITAPLIVSVQPCFSWLIIPANIFAITFFESILLPIALFNSVVSFWAKFTEPFLTFIFSGSQWLTQFEKPILCFDEGRNQSWGLIYYAVIYLVWRSFLPFLLRKKFWKNQMRFHGQKSSSIGTWAKATS